MELWKYVAVAAIGYLLGSIPVGLVVVWLMRGVDVRTVGSGRTGGTNAYRAAGLAAGLATGLGDAAKGLLAVWLAHLLLPGAGAAAVAGLAAIVGHNWSVYIGFRGGAGTAPNLGALLGLSPVAFLLGLAAGVVAMIASRIASVASLSVSVVAALVIGVLILLHWHPAPYLLYGLGQLVLVVVALVPNIQRLLRGNERQVTY
jgi:glycerol-3-phosphate acyltransferase PlsY